jgi:hypothetical protein
VSALFRILIVVPLGYVAACLMAGLVFALSVYGFTNVESPAAGLVLVAFGFAVAGYAGAFAAIPMLVAVGLAETFRWRSFFFWSLLGGVLGFAANAVVDGTAAEPTPGVVALYAAAGFAAGATYWLIAGRRSGLIERGTAGAVSPINAGSGGNP